MMGTTLQPRTPGFILTQTSGKIESSWRISATKVGVPYIVVGEDAFEVDVLELTEQTK
jgi:hypothetical protein